MLYIDFILEPLICNDDKPCHLNIFNVEARVLIDILAMWNVCDFVFAKKNPAQKAGLSQQEKTHFFTAQIIHFCS